MAAFLSVRLTISRPNIFFEVSLAATNPPFKYEIEFFLFANNHINY